MPRFNNTERIGVNEVEKIFLDFGWIPRSIFQTDVGLDMEVEICEDGTPTGKLFAVQIKTEESYFKEKDIDSVIFRPTPVHLNYWLNHTLPVLIVLHNPKTNETIWESVDKERINRSRKKIHIPFHQRLGPNSKEEIKELNNHPAPYLRLQRLQLHKDLMTQIQNGVRIIVEATRWVNKSIGRAEINIINADDFTKDVVISHAEYIFFKGVKDLYELFPWADFQIDEDYYDDEEEDAYSYEHGIWDPEDKKYYFRDQTYDEYKKKAPKIRALPDSSGELETYRLEMSLNKVGKAFLEIEGYLNNKL